MTHWCLRHRLTVERVRLSIFPLPFIVGEKATDLLFASLSTFSAEPPSSPSSGAQYATPLITTQESKNIAVCYGATVRDWLFVGNNRNQTALCNQWFLLKRMLLTLPECEIINFLKEELGFVSSSSQQSCMASRAWNILGSESENLLHSKNNPPKPQKQNCRGAYL